MVENPVAQQDISTDPRDADQYDFAEIQQRWLPVWDELAPFRSRGSYGCTSQEVRH